MNDFMLYSKEHQKYHNFSKKLFWFQKYKDQAWTKGENFGDYLSKVIVSEVAIHKNLKQINLTNTKLLAIGSIMHFANTNDTIWGSGINGKINNSRLEFQDLNVKAVRGPLTHQVLEKKGIKVPAVYADPAILLPNYFPELKYKPIKNKTTVIPNLNEYIECKKYIPSNMKLISPLIHWTKVVHEILTSELVFTSSLHGLIISEAFNVPVLLFQPFGGETLFKYIDYVEGTHRLFNHKLKTFEMGINESNGVALSEPTFNRKLLLSSFPSNIFI